MEPSDPTAEQPTTGPDPVPVADASVAADDPGPTADAPGTAGSGRGRAGLLGVLGVLTVLLIVISTVGVWARVTVFSTQRSVAIVNSALEQPEVAAALADYLTTQVATAVDLETVVSDALPDSLQAVAPAITSGITQAVERGLTAALETPEVEAIVDEVIERAHALALRLLEGDGLASGLTVDDGEVSINLLPLVDRGIRLVAKQGLIDEPDHPPMTVDGDPATQLAQLEELTGRQLPDDFGQLVVYQSDQLARAQQQLSRAQQVVALSKRAVVVIALAALVLGAVTVFLSRNRWRALLWLGLGIATGMVLLRASVREVVNAAPDLAKADGGRAAIDAIANQATSSLLRLAGGVLVVAVILCLVALMERNWTREDYGPVSAALAFGLVIALLGVTVPGLLVAIVAGIALPYLLQRGHLERAAAGVVDHVRPDRPEPEA